MKKSSFLRIVMTAIICLSATATWAQFPLYGWRGPERNGTYPEKGLLKKWPAEGPAKLWEVLDVGKGNSSPTIADGRIFLTGMNEDGSKEILSAYTMEGKKLYSVELGTPWNHTFHETRTTPTYYDGKIYVICGGGEIICVSAADGKIVWKVNGGETYKRKVNNYGTAESPLVFEDKVIYTPAGELTTMVALNAKTGKEVWRTKSLGDVGAYVSPILIKYKGKKQIIGSTSSHLIGVNPKSGEIEWSVEIPRGHHGDLGNPAANSPIFKNGRVFISEGYDVFSYMIELSDDLKSAKVVWENKTLDTHFGGYVELNGVIYGSSHITNGSGNWCAIDWQTGQTLYEHTWEGKSKGAIIAADGMLICYEERRGTIGLIRPSREKFDLVSEFRITSGEGPHWAHPVVNNGVLYIRHNSALIAYKIK